MTDVILLAVEKRARLMGEIEAIMAEIEKLEDFIEFGNALARPEKPAVPLHIAAE